MKYYIASDIFSTANIELINSIATVLREWGHEVFVPHEHSIQNGESMENSVWAKKVFQMDTAAIQEADTILYLCEGMSGDVGAAWECGFAYALGKKISVMDLNVLCESLSDRTGKISLMAACSASWGTTIMSYRT